MGPRIERIEAAAYTIPTDFPESDGTLEWDRTTLVLLHLHLHLCCALEPVVYLEWFHDHARIERMLFDGAAQPVEGRLSPPPLRRKSDAETGLALLDLPGRP